MYRINSNVGTANAVARLAVLLSISPRRGIVKIHFIDLQAQYRRYQQEIGRAIQSVLDSSQYIQGNDVFEL